MHATRDFGTHLHACAAVPPRNVRRLEMLDAIDTRARLMFTYLTVVISPARKITPHAAYEGHRRQCQV